MEFKTVQFNNRKFLFFLFLFALILRLTVAIYSYENKSWEKFGDDNARKRFALSILENGFIPETNTYFREESIFAPLVPVVIAIFTYVFGDTWLPIFILNAILGAVTCFVYYKISRFFFSEAISLLTMLWAAMYPFFIRYIGTAGNEPWIVLLFSLTFLYALKTIYKERVDFNIVLYSIFFVLLIHTDERYVSYLVFFGGILFIGYGEIFVKLKKIFLFILLTIILSSPWLIRNYLYYDDIVLISVRTIGITGQFVKHREALDVFDHTSDNTYLSPSQIDSVKSGLLDKFNNGRTIPSAQISAIKEGNIPHLFSMTEKFISRLYFLWTPIKLNDNYRITGYDFNPRWSLAHNLLSGLSYGLLLPFMFLGLYHIIINQRYREFIIFWGAVFFHTLIHLVFIPYTRDRYRHPIDFIIFILSLYGLTACFDYIQHRYIKTSKVTGK